MDTNINNLNLQRTFGKPILKTGKPTVYPHSIIATRKEIRGSEPSVIRTLRADEWEALREGAKAKEANQVHLDALLLTGCRYVEGQRIHDHPEWFDGHFIYIPASAVLKLLVKEKERYIRLNELGKKVLPLFFKTKQLPTSDVWRENLCRWAANVGLDPIGLGPKTTRKTWESWLVTTYPNQTLGIVQSQGHTKDTSLNHYLNMPFLQSDKDRMKPWVDGFF